MHGPVTHSLVKALRAVPGFASLDDRHLLAIVGDSANLFWTAGSLVFAQGSPADGLYLVISGAVRVLDSGTELAVLGPGDFFGEISLLLDTEHMRDVEAVDDTELMVLPKEFFDLLIVTSPELASHIRQKLEERLQTDAAAER